MAKKIVPPFIPTVVRGFSKYSIYYGSKIAQSLKKHQFMKKNNNGFAVVSCLEVYFSLKSLSQYGYVTNYLH